MTAKYSRHNIFVVENLDEAGKRYLESDKLPHHILCDSFLVCGRLPDCDKLLYLSDLFDGSISPPWLCTLFLPNLPLEAKSSGQILTTRNCWSGKAWLYQLRIKKELGNLACYDFIG